jgi:PilZ domain-containing protein
VEQRREHRFEPNQSVTLKVLGIRPGPIMSASVRDISGSGMRLRTSLPVPCGTPIEIEAQETLILGSVCRCEPDNGSYTIGVQISETGRPRRTLGGAQRD